MNNFLGWVIFGCKFALCFLIFAAIINKALNLHLENNDFVIVTFLALVLGVFFAPFLKVG